jgi:hypothetical protein
MPTLSAFNDDIVTTCCAIFWEERAMIAFLNNGYTCYPVLLSHGTLRLSIATFVPIFNLGPVKTESA